ncbi:hypothetical protein PVAP13_9KG516052 [Panicum virgatum]|uniref:Tf2-1-like SH3-like domain-containing protein n=1 Tax=Panicum virgatum TaxID=38727 RepID=A0A8T0NUR7_PANVG|nr:hypothetical protein PVAP13_9KG516052 [Panicum virgatum]
MKQQADKKRTERSFAVGDQVYLKLQPYVQSSLAPRANQKLAYKFFGPFLVIDKIGQVAHKLQLPAHSQIHHVSHVSQLKKVVPSALSPAAVPVDLMGLQIPERVLAKRMHPDGSKLRSQVLIQWSGLDSSLVTWDNVDSLCQQFPQSPALEQASCYCGGVSATQVPARLWRPLQLGCVGANEPLSPTANTLATNGPERCQPVNRRLYREDCEERGTHEHYCNKLFLPLFYKEAVLVASSSIPLASFIASFL